ncbi:DUF4290 domain-containing protein [Blattabacterium punctulatus]|uniref:DUF4290 domain-containing protein n=1 Tax=Blattabacterium punctulatus TaxID=164514 RepID=UPI000D7BDEC2|nr:DUF4290 domain-containing protein [Blattabacterium punctulatus]AWU44163.1 DUF4290 domain-containing protein [Blattabacterium punctulatus]
MEYNTNRFKLVIPEYGRNIHKMIDYAIKIKNRKERNRCAWSIIKLMTYSNPRFKIPYFQHKLWNQLFIMSKYQLDIDTPFPKPSPEKRKIYHYKKVVYPDYLTNFRYYGKIIRNMIYVAINCKNSKKKEGLFYAIANTMKKNYLRWNKNIVEDDIIFKDLKDLSKGKICLMNKTNPLLQSSYLLNPKRKKNYMRKKYEYKK